MMFQLVDAIWRQTVTGRLLGNIDPTVVLNTRGGLRPVDVWIGENIYVNAKFKQKFN